MRPLENWTLTLPPLAAHVFADLDADGQVDVLSGGTGGGFVFFRNMATSRGGATAESSHGPESRLVGRGVTGHNSHLHYSAPRVSCSLALFVFALYLNTTTAPRIALMFIPKKNSSNMVGRRREA
jgi:hypothetical protein